MAPEQISGGELTPAVDIFSVGAVLFELLTNKKPFEADTLHRVLFKIVADPTPDVTMSAPDLPAGLASIVAKALAKEPLERFRSASDMANALAAVRATLGTPRLSRTVSQRSSIDRILNEQRAAQEQQKAALAAAATAAGPAGGGIWKTAAIGAVTIALVAVIGGGIMVLRRDSAPQAASSTPPVQSTNPPRADSPQVAATTPDARTTAAPPPAAPATPTREPARDQPRVASNTPTSTSTPQRRPDARPSGSETTQGSAAPKVAVADTQKAAAPTSTTGAQGSVAAPQQGQPLPAPTTTQSNVVAPPPAPVTAPSLPAAAEPENSRPAITAVIAAYSKAIGTRSVAEIRRVYVGMNAQQQSAWENFFSSIRSIEAKLSIASLDVTGGTATARLAGEYEFVDRSGRTQRQPANFQATLEKDGTGWVLRKIQ